MPNRDKTGIASAVRSNATRWKRRLRGGTAFEGPTNEGYCPCCRSATVFCAQQPWLRDFYVCTRCVSLPRQRHVQWVLDTRFPGWEERSIHEAGPSGHFIHQFARSYTASQYLPHLPPGAFEDGMRNEDVERLTFADESVELFITQDILEHVFDPAAAVREIHRTLTPGGAHIFTTPQHRGLAETVQRARRGIDGSVEDLLPANYHGSPVGDNRALVTFDYGDDFPALLAEWSGQDVEVIRTVDRDLGIDAEFNEVYVIRKPERDWPAATPEPAAAQRPVVSGSVSADRRELDALRREMTDARAAIAELHNSTSWRVTGPLRSVGGLVAKLRSRAG